MRNHYLLLLLLVALWTAGMFERVYQGGPAVEVFTPQGKDPTTNWKLSGSVTRLFDKAVKRFVLLVVIVSGQHRVKLIKKETLFSSLSLISCLHFVKSYVYQCEGGASSKMTITKDSSTNFLGLTQPFLCFQVCSVVVRCASLPIKSLCPSILLPCFRRFLSPMEKHLRLNSVLSTHRAQEGLCSIWHFMNVGANSTSLS